MKLFDPGLQPERTELAWRRTALSIGVGSLVALRLLPVALGHPGWSGVGVLGLIAATGLWYSTRVRMRRIGKLLARGGDRVALPGAVLMTVTAGLTAIFGVGTLVMILSTI